MNDTEAKKSNGDSRNGQSKWIWVALAVLLGVIVLGKFAGRGPFACCGGGICALPAAVAGSNTGSAVAAMSVAAVAVPARAERLPRLVDFGAGTCIPCKMMAPILEELKQTCAGKLEVEIMDVRANPDEASKRAIRLIPTQIFYDATGKELFRHEGFFAKEDILAKWKAFGVELPVAKVVPAN